MASTTVITLPIMQEHVDVGDLEDGSFFLYGGGDLYEVLDNGDYVHIETGSVCDIDPRNKVIPVKVRIEVFHI